MSTGQKQQEGLDKVVHLLYEVGTLRRIPRMHRQVLLSDDTTDTIASHSFRVALISFFLAQEEGVDYFKAVMMALIHDLAEARSNDHNWVHKKYITIHEDEISNDQLGSLPNPILMTLLGEYKERKSREAVLVKDADLLDQLLLLREYELTGNKEAATWLYGKRVSGRKAQLEKLAADTAKRFGERMYEISPSEWWRTLYTNKNR
jgi:putative hydrolase of HD superfamily